MQEKVKVTSGHFVIRMPDFYIIDIGESKVTKRKWVKISFNGEEKKLFISDSIIPSVNVTIV